MSRASSTSQVEDDYLDFMKIDNELEQRAEVDQDNQDSGFINEDEEQVDELNQVYMQDNSATGPSSHTTNTTLESSENSATNVGPGDEVLGGVGTEFGDETGGGTTEDDAESSKANFVLPGNGVFVLKKNPESTLDIEITILHRKQYSSNAKEDNQITESQEKLVNSWAMKFGVDQASLDAFHTASRRSKLLRGVNGLKYKSAVEKKRKATVVQKDYPETAAALVKMLLGAEELAHPWNPSISIKLPNGGLFLRVTTETSKGRAYPGKGFFSYGSNARFSTHIGRKADLTEHARFKGRYRGPFISTFASPYRFFGKGKGQGIYHYLERDQKKLKGRCTVKIYVINANARVAEGYPTLDFKAELEHYEVKLDAGSDYGFFKDEWVLPLRIPSSQIVGTYCWEEVEKAMSRNGWSDLDWYQNVAVPDFAKHEGARQEGVPVEKRAGCGCDNCH